MAAAAQKPEKPEWYMERDEEHTIPDFHVDPTLSAALSALRNSPNVTDRLLASLAEGQNIQGKELRYQSEMLAANVKNVGELTKSVNNFNEMQLGIVKQRVDQVFAFFENIQKWRKPVLWVGGLFVTIFGGIVAPLMLALAEHFVGVWLK